MKDISLLVWMTQLGLSVVLPLAGFILLAVWLKNVFNFGVWIIIAGVVLGLVCAVNGLVSSLKVMQTIAKNKNEKTPPVSFNDHD